MMARLYDANGNFCGNHTGAVPTTYFIRPDNDPDELEVYDFIARIGAARFKLIFDAMISNHTLAYPFFRIITAPVVRFDRSFAQLKALETAGVLTAGSAAAIWS